jgi:hypothetical protein
MKLTTLDAAVEAATLTVNAVIEAPAAIIKAGVSLAKKINVTLKGNHDTLMFDGKPAPSREAIKKLAPEAGITYLGRNSNQEKCVCCSPLAKNVNWMHVAFTQDGIAQDTWICEGCSRAYPSTKGKKNFQLLKDAKKK